MFKQCNGLEETKGNCILTCDAVDEMFRITRDFVCKEVIKRYVSKQNKNGPNPMGAYDPLSLEEVRAIVEDIQKGGKE